MNLKSGQHIESACHIPDARSDYRCLTDEDFGVDATTCRRRSCSILWVMAHHMIPCLQEYFYEHVKITLYKK